MTAEYQILRGDCLDQLRTFYDDIIDAVVTDPPYELGFMGKKWDATGIAYRVDLWREILRVLKPGGHILAFGGTRTYHRMACAIEDAGFEVRDCLQWLYGTGFPKSLNIGDGRGTALKPACEPVVMARKPIEGTVAANVQKWGTGALNIDGCRIESGGDYHELEVTQGGKQGGGFDIGSSDGTRRTTFVPAAGRWPANVLLDEEAAAALDEMSGTSKSTGGKRGGTIGDSGIYNVFNPMERANAGGLGDSGGASRFFYVAKASRKERDAGCENLPLRTGGEATDREDGSDGLKSPRAGAGRTGGARNHHPTVKPIALMRHLVRLVTPPGGIVLDPFAGSGSTGCAAVQEGFNFLGIEREEEYAEIAEARLATCFR